MTNKSAGIRININVERTGTEMILTRDCGDTFTIRDTRRNEELIDFFSGTDEYVTPQQITDEDIKTMAFEKYPVLKILNKSFPPDGLDANFDDRCTFIEGAKAIRNLLK